MALIKVYLLSGKHVDVESKKDTKLAAQEIALNGVWCVEREEKILHPASQILRIRVCKESK